MLPVGCRAASHMPVCAAAAAAAAAAPTGTAMMYSHPATCSVYIKHLPEEVRELLVLTAVLPPLFAMVHSETHDTGAL
jgi:hypothetical protein